MEAVTPCTVCRERNATRGDLCKRCAGVARDAAYHARKMARLMPATAPCNVCGETVGFLDRVDGPRQPVDPETGRDHWHPIEDRPEPTWQPSWRQDSNA